MTDAELARRAVAVLRAGGVVALPTETVYGLAADVANPAAIARVYAIKGRPADHPLIVHAHDLDALAATSPRSRRSCARSPRGSGPGR